jgi:hypothetical protein
MKVWNIYKLGLVFSLISATSVLADDEFEIFMNADGTEMHGRSMTMRLSDAKQLDDSSFWQTVNNEFNITSGGYSIQSEYWEDQPDFRIYFSEPAYLALLKRVENHIPSPQQPHLRVVYKLTKN